VAGNAILPFNTPIPWNAFAPMVKRAVDAPSARAVITVPLKALAPIESNDDVVVTVPARVVHPVKALAPMDLRLVPAKVIEFDVVFAAANALSAIDTTAYVSAPLIAVAATARGFLATPENPVSAHSNGAIDVTL